MIGLRRRPGGGGRRGARRALCGLGRLAGGLPPLPATEKGTATGPAASATHTKRHVAIISARTALTLSFIAAAVSCSVSRDRGTLEAPAILGI